MLEKPKVAWEPSTALSIRVSTGHVALKFLPPEKLADPERKRRFIQEAKTASSLNHPNIVTIYDIGAEGEVEFIVMELGQG